MNSGMKKQVNRDDFISMFFGGGNRIGGIVENKILYYIRNEKFSLLF